MKKGSRLQPLARAVLRTQSDERLVALAREGRDAAFEEIVRRYRPGLVAFAAAYAPSERAEDVVQESFMSSWDAMRRSTEEIRLKPWLYTIVRNRALNARRDARAHTPLSDEIDGVREPAEIVLTNEELARVVSAVGALPEAQRQALVRSAIEGHTHEQIAASIGSSPGAVRQLIYRARLTVREGVGFLVPLPIVRMLVEAGSGEALAGGAVAGGAAMAGTAGGASMLSKATVVAVVGTIAAASGVAIERSANDRGSADPPGNAAVSDDGGASAAPPRPAEARAAPPTARDRGRAATVRARAVRDRVARTATTAPGPAAAPMTKTATAIERAGVRIRSGGSGSSSGPGSGEAEVEAPVVDDDNSGSGGGSGSGSSGSGSSGSGTSGSGSRAASTRAGLARAAAARAGRARAGRTRPSRTRAAPAPAARGPTAATRAVRARAAPTRPARARAESSSHPRSLSWTGSSGA